MERASHLQTPCNSMDFLFTRAWDGPGTFEVRWEGAPGCLFAGGHWAERLEALRDANVDSEDALGCSQGLSPLYLGAVSARREGAGLASRQWRLQNFQVEGAS